MMSRTSAVPSAVLIDGIVALQGGAGTAHLARQTRFKGITVWKLINSKGQQ
jgi:hypothetical protein